MKEIKKKRYQESMKKTYMYTVSRRQMKQNVEPRFILQDSLQRGLLSYEGLYLLLHVRKPLFPDRW